MEFSSLVEKIKNTKPHPKDHGYHKSVLNIIEKQKELIKLLQKIYEEQSFVRGTFESFINDLSTTIKKGKKLNESNPSIKKYLEHYMLQYSSLVIENDKDVLMVKNVSLNILNNYHDFLFIVKLLDDNFVMTGILKLLIGKLNTELLYKKIFIKNFL